jgi:hypothetical protein
MLWREPSSHIHTLCVVCVCPGVLLLLSTIIFITLWDRKRHRRRLQPEARNRQRHNRDDTNENESPHRFKKRSQNVGRCFVYGTVFVILQIFDDRYEVSCTSAWE